MVEKKSAPKKYNTKKSSTYSTPIQASLKKMKISYVYYTILVDRMKRKKQNLKLVVLVGIAVRNNDFLKMILQTAVMSYIQLEKKFLCKYQPIM